MADRQVYLCLCGEGGGCSGEQGLIDWRAPDALDFVSALY